MLEPLRHILSAKRIVLASGSPRRKEILENARIQFEVIPALGEENLDKNAYGSEPWRYAEDTAAAKAHEVFDMVMNQSELPSPVVIGADTVVALGEVIYGKPRSQEDALQMLSKLSGRSHKVFTGVCLVKASGDAKVAKTFHAVTTVHFDCLSAEVIKGYVDTQEPMDKAGGYGIQAIGGTLITGIDGDYFNVMGFPLNMFCREFANFIQNKETSA